MYGVFGMKYLRIALRELLTLAIAVSLIVFVLSNKTQGEEKPVLTKKMQKQIKKGKPLSKRQQKKVKQKITKKVKHVKARRDISVRVKTRKIKQYKKVLVTIAKRVCKKHPIGKVLSLGILGAKQKQNLKNHIDKLRAKSNGGGVDP